LNLPPPNPPPSGLPRFGLPLASLDAASLSAAYAGGAASPVQVARLVLDRIAAAGQDHVWISRCPDDAILARAQALAAAGPAGLPLYGLPFAVKDNIDAAGLETTAGCPAFAYRPAASAPCVQRLLDAGAMLIGKTNLDQFATGLVGIRSPHGTPRNPFDPAMPPGGSSSGSAVAVASGLVSFALGTDTAGSGRVPAAFNNIVGLKPTRGLISPRGMVPACRPYDCVSIFALTVADAVAVLAVAQGFDPREAFSRAAPAGFTPRHAAPAGFRFGVPRAAQRRFFGDAEAARLFDAAIARAETQGGVPTEIDFDPWLEAAALLYGPLVAERTAVVGDFIAAHPGAVDPVVAGIVAQGTAIPGAAVLRAQHRLAELAQAIRPVWQDIDALLVPTTGTAFSLAQLHAEPVLRNSELGTYTNFTNLLDLAAIAVPNGFTAAGFPVGVTLIGPAWHDGVLAALAASMHAAAGTPLGATGIAQPAAAAPPPAAAVQPMTAIAVFGAHLAGQPLNPDLLALGGVPRGACRTAPVYRMKALPGRIERPGLVRAAQGGVSIGGEIWALPAAAVAAFLATIGPPLGLGRVAMDDGSACLGFICEGGATVEAAPDISRFGDWRAYLRSKE
jgi:allophanate hydrolase